MSPVALVTGGGTGIGAACCRALAEAGFRVAVHHRTSGATAERVAAELPMRSRCAPISPYRPRWMRWSAARGARGRVDVLVNNAERTATAPRRP